MKRAANFRGVGPLLALWFSAAGPAAASDAFFKGGFVVRPSSTQLSDRWLLSFGSDYPINYEETLFVGFELQTAYYRERVGADTVQIVPGHGFINAKFKSAQPHVRPYGGGGLGALTFFGFLPGDTNWNRSFAFHLLGGVELGRLSVELQAARAFESGGRLRWSLLFGLVW
jgi:hypothetical protein